MTVPRLNTTGRFDPNRLFHSHSVAVIGADSDAGAQILANLAMAGFKGEVRTRIESQHPSGDPGRPCRTDRRGDGRTGRGRLFRRHRAGPLRRPRVPLRPHRRPSARPAQFRDGDSGLGAECNAVAYPAAGGAAGGDLAVLGADAGGDRLGRAERGRIQLYRRGRRECRRRLFDGTGLDIARFPHRRDPARYPPHQEPPSVPLGGARRGPAATGGGDLSGPAAVGLRRRRSVVRGGATPSRGAVCRTAGGPAGGRRNAVARQARCAAIGSPLSAMRSALAASPPTAWCERGCACRRAS